MYPEAMPGRLDQNPSRKRPNHAPQERGVPSSAKTSVPDIDLRALYRLERLHDPQRMPWGGSASG